MQTYVTTHHQNTNLLFFSFFSFCFLFDSDFFVPFFSHYFPAGPSCLPNYVHNDLHMDDHTATCTVLRRATTPFAHTPDVGFASDGDLKADGSSATNTDTVFIGIADATDSVQATTSAIVHVDSTDEVNPFTIPAQKYNTRQHQLSTKQYADKIHTSDCHNTNTKHSDTDFSSNSSSRSNRPSMQAQPPIQHQSTSSVDQHDEGKSCEGDRSVLEQGRDVSEDIGDTIESTPASNDQEVEILDEAKCHERFGKAL